MPNRPRPWIASVAATTMLLGFAPGARAEVVHETPFTDTYSYDYSDCGFPVHVEGEVTVSANWRTAENTGAPFRLSRERVSGREVHTNPANGTSFTVSGRQTFNEVNVRRVEGDIYEVRQVLAGPSTVIRDSSGRMVAKDRGSIHIGVLFETTGGGEPRFAGFSDFAVHGPHDTDFCAVVGALAGISDSSERYRLRPLGTTGSPMGYTEYLPPDYAEGGSSPLLVFLHGSGEGGDGSADQLPALARAAIPAYIAHDAWPDDRPFVVLAPQHGLSGDLSPYSVCEQVEFGASCAFGVQHELGNPSEGSICMTPDAVHDFIRYATDTYDVDPDRVYLTGLSCGGFGVWEYLSEYGGSQVAAAVPVSGEGRPAWDTAGCELGAVPLWALHGGADPVVDPLGSIEPVEMLQACTSPGATDAGLVVFPDASHDADMWARSYAVRAEHDIYTWMSGHTRS